MKAAWGLVGYPIWGRSHLVDSLAIYSRNQQEIIFKEKKENEVWVEWETTLKAWFKLNKYDDFARTLKLLNIPPHYVFNKSNKILIKKKIIKK